MSFHAESCRFAVALLLDEGTIPGGVIERLEDGGERNLVVRGEFFGRAGFGTVDDLVNNRGADSTALDEELAVIRTGTRLKMLILRGDDRRHDDTFDEEESGKGKGHEAIEGHVSATPRAWQ